MAKSPSQSQPSSLAFPLATCHTGGDTRASQEGRYAASIESPMNARRLIPFFFDLLKTAHRTGVRC
jgi:hypothetical protein